MTTPTNDRQTSERERIAGLLEKHYDLYEAAAQLRADEAEIAALKSAFEQVSRGHIDHVQALNNELAALRAENEALRTVTEEDVNRTSARTGVMPVDVRKALQSFIRSKESSRG